MCSGLVKRQEDKRATASERSFAATFGHKGRRSGGRPAFAGRRLAADDGHAILRQSSLRTPTADDFGVTPIAVVAGRTIDDTVRHH
jgi:hypothetical protein